MNKLRFQKKVLFIMTEEHIKKGFIQTLKWLKEKRYVIHIVSDIDEEIQYCDKHFRVSFYNHKIQAYKLLKRIVRENNYEFIQCYNLLGRISTMLAVRKTNTKFIYISKPFPFYKGSPIKNWLIYYPIEKYLSKYTDILITTNQEDYILAKNKFKIPKIKLIEVGYIDEVEFNLQLYEQEKKIFLNEFGLKKEDYVFLNVGNLDKNNNQILQIEAIIYILSEYKNIKLLIAGEGPLEEYYSNIIEKYGLNENIKLIGDRKDISRLIQLSDCLLVTNIINRETTNIINAMFANKPIIASRIKEHKELLKDEYLVDLKTSDELISKIEKSIIAGKRKIHYNIEKYKYDNVDKNMKEIYESFI